MRDTEETHPLLTTSTLPYQLAPFDRIVPEHFVTGFAEAMRRQRETVELIAANPEAATFENTVVALEEAGALLNRIESLFFNLLSANGNAEMEAIQSDVSPKLSLHRDAIMLDHRLFERVNAVYEAGVHGASWHDEAAELVRRYQLDFVRAGANLGATDKARLCALNSELAALSSSFGQNARKEASLRALVVEDLRDLAGLTESEINAAQSAARERGLDAGFLLPMMSPTQQPALSTLSQRDVRRRLFEASLTRGASGGEFDNRAVVARIAGLRAERARLLGYRTHADYVLADNTAASVARVNQFLAELVPRAREKAELEAKVLQSTIDAQGGGFLLEAHDWAYYGEKTRLATLSFDESAVRPYFELHNVLHRGVFFAAERLYGLKCVARHDLPVYHPDVDVYEVFDADGSPLALLLTDFYARPGKSGGAWMNEYVSQSELLGQRPVVGNHLNVPKPGAGAPALLTFSEVVTMFHEFGHALHGIFSKVRYPRFSGTNVPLDFVEFPSQINEMWATWPEVLKNYARHYETQAPMPEALLQKVLGMRGFMQGMATTEYLAAALLDQAWHQVEAAVAESDVEAFETRALKSAGIALSGVPPRYRSTYFRHIFAGGYAAGYYAYLWGEVLDADGAAWFEEHGGLSRANGDWLRTAVLSRGGSLDAGELFKRFRGRDPDASALMRRRGLEPSPA